MNSTALESFPVVNSYKCFANKDQREFCRLYAEDTWNLHVDFSRRAPVAETRRLEAFGRVIPLLICGEQSAISVFGSSAESEAGVDMRLLQREFLRIEGEEAGHELLWQTLSANLPTPSDARMLKRRAAVFFAKLGRANSVGEHFAQVSQLDSAVGAIMWCLERSEIARDPRIERVANLIKRDEARHVSVSRKFAFGLGISRDEFEALGDRIRHELVKLLNPVADSIEDLGIDASAMFQRIARS